MATCPNCGVHGYEAGDNPAFTLDEGFEAKPLGTWSLAGAQLKMTGWMRPRLTCNHCGWWVLGIFTEANGERFFMGDPSTQHFPAPDADS